MRDIRHHITYDTILWFETQTAGGNVFISVLKPAP